MRARLLEQDSDQNLSATAGKGDQLKTASDSFQEPYAPSNNSCEDIRPCSALVAPSLCTPRQPNRRAAGLMSLREICISTANEIYLAQAPRRCCKLTATKVPVCVVDLLRKYYNHYIAKRAFRSWRRWHLQKNATQAQLVARLKAMRDYSARNAPVDSKESTSIVERWGRMKLAVRWDRRRVLRGVLLRWLHHMVTACVGSTDTRTLEGDGGSGNVTC